MGKKILKVSLLSLLILVAFVFFALTVLSFSAPLYMASKFEDLGLNSLAYGCYDREYKSTQKVDEQYTMFNKAVDINFDTHIVYYGERLINNSNYEVLWTKISMDNSAKAEKYILDNPTLSDNAKNLLRITSFNEDNYIKNRYVAALIEVDKSYVAKEFVFNEMNAAVKNNKFSKYTSVMIGTYVEKTGKLSLPEIKKIETFFDAFVLECSPNLTVPTTEDLIVAQRLFETATAISTAYERLGNLQMVESWNNTATNYYSAIYGE